MYFRESDILLRDNPEYEIYINTIDNFLSTLISEERNQLNIRVVADITGVEERIVEFIFDYYCRVKVMNIDKYIVCPISGDIIKNVETSRSGEFEEFCDTCGEEHILTERDIVNRYSISSVRKLEEISREIKPSSGESLQISNESEGNISQKKITISIKKQEVVRIATIQLNFELSSDRFPPEIVDKERVKSRIKNALTIAKEHKANLVCLPELSICDEWLPEIKSQSTGMIIIAGSNYDKEGHNKCQILYSSNDVEIPPQIKIKPSEFESPRETGNGMVSGNNIYIYETAVGIFSVLICRDFGNYINDLADKVDIIFVPSYNSSPDRFETTAHAHVQDHPSYIIISNTALYGGTSIFGQMDKAHFKKLEQHNCKQAGDDTYKLCYIERGKEGIIIADFNTSFKGIQKPTPIDPGKVKRPVTEIKKLDL